MALTPSAAWLQAMQVANPEIRMLATITHLDTSTMSATSGYCQQMTYPEGISGVGDVAAEVDPLTREPKVGQVALTVHDAWLRPIAVTKRLKGQKIALSVGAACLAEGDFLSYFLGQIDEIEPCGMRDQGEDTVTLTDAFGFDDVSIVGKWVCKHPLQVLYAGDGTGVLELAGVPSSLIDTASFDVTSATYAAISPWAVSRAGQNSGKDGSLSGAVKASEIVSEMCALLMGQLITKEDGKISFKLFDPTASAVATLTKDDWHSIKQRPIDRDIINRVEVAWGVAHQDTGDRNRSFVLDDTASQAAYAFSGSAARVMDYKVESPWFSESGKCAQLLTGITALSASLDVYGAGHALTGTRGMPAAQTADQQIGASSPAYLMLTDNQGAVEIVKAESCTFVAGGHVEVINPRDQAVESVGTACKVTYGSLTRAQFGTSAAAWDAMDYVYDMTIQVAIASAILQRQKYGCPPLEIELPFHWFWIQRGDLLTITWPDFLAYGMDGLTTATKWEVISKQASPNGSPPNVKLVLAVAANEALTTAGYDWHCGLATREQEAMESTYYVDVQDAYVVSGFTTTYTVGTKLAMVAPGVASVCGARVRMLTQKSQNCSASKDTYVSFNFKTCTLFWDPVNNGAAQPALPPDSMWIAKVVTDATVITSVTDKRTVKPIGGAALRAGAGVLAHMTSSGTMDNLTSIDTRVIDSLTDNTYARPLAAALSAGKVNLAAGSGGLANQLPGAQIADSAISTAKVADDAIVAQKFAVSSVRGSSILPNANFAQRSRG